MSDIRFEISASAVAWYAAIISTISLVTAIIVMLRDRAKICIKYRRNTIITNSAVYDQNKTYFNITVINKGRRPISISTVGIRIINTERNYVVLSDSISGHINKVLTVTNPSAQFFLEQDEELLSRAWYITVFDQTGREYRKYMHRFHVLWFLYHKLKFSKNIQ